MCKKVGSRRKELNLCALKWQNYFHFATMQGEDVWDGIKNVGFWVSGKYSAKFDLGHFDGWREQAWGQRRRRKMIRPIICFSFVYVQICKQAFICTILTLVAFALGNIIYDKATAFYLSLIQAFQSSQANDFCWTWNLYPFLLLFYLFDILKFPFYVFLLPILHETKVRRLDG